MDTKVLRNLSYGVYIATTMDEKRPVGCVVNSVMQITSDPATIAISINHENYTHNCIQKYGKFAVNILPENVDMSLIGTFGFQSSKEVDKFKEIQYVEKQGLPTLFHTSGILLCKVVNQIETSTHTIFISEILDTVTAEINLPMTYKYYHEVKKGISPKKAPTYLDEDIPASKKTIWVCSVCGYTVEADELPDDFKCPICGQGKEVFYKK